MVLIWESVATPRHRLVQPEIRRLADEQAYSSEVLPSKSNGQPVSDQQQATAELPSSPKVNHRSTRHVPALGNYSTLSKLRIDEFGEHPRRSNGIWSISLC